MLKTTHRSPNKKDIELGFKIRKLRQDQKLTLKEVAEQISVSTQQLRKYELGRNKIPARRLGQVAEILGVNIDVLVGSTPIVEEKIPRSELDREAERLWKRISSEHKPTILSIMRIIADNNPDLEP